MAGRRFVFERRDVRTEVQPARNHSQGSSSCAPLIRSESLDTIPSKIDPASPGYLRNRERNIALRDELWAALGRVKESGGEDAVAKHRARGKMLARERIDALIDPGAPFLEFSPLAGWGMYDDEAPGAGIVTGIGPIHGQECVIVANDATVKGGTYFPITVKKHLRAQQIALENRLPCV